MNNEVVERVAKRVWEGMGLIVLHSGHFSKIFKRLMGTPCALKWREAGERERLWVINPRHPIAAGPWRTISSWKTRRCTASSSPFQNRWKRCSFRGSRAAKSSAPALTWRRGAGNIFYFRPGHETYPTYHNETVQKVLINAVKWAHQSARHAGEHP